MIYTMYTNSDLLYDPKFPAYTVIDPILDLSVNEPGLLTFSVPDGHPCAARIQKLVSVVKVYRDGRIIFKGRIIKDEKALNAQTKYTAEGCLAYLIDSVCDPYEFSGTPAEFFTFLINRHNASVSANQQFLIGNCTVTADSEIQSHSVLYDSTWQVLKERLVKRYGGYLHVTYNYLEKPVLNWLADPPDTATQQIQFGENLIDIAVTKDADETYTACVPLGARMSAIDPAYESDARLTIADVNDGDPHLIDTANAAIYGIIYAPLSETTWDNVTLPTNLLQRGQAWLVASGARLKETISLTAVDLHSMDADIECFQFLDRVIVTCGNICPQAEFVLTKMTIPLQNPAAMRITLGDSRISLVADNTSKIADAVDRIEGIEADYVTNSEATEIVQHEITNNTSIIQSAQQIILSALEDYVTTSDFNALQSTIQTTLWNHRGELHRNEL